MISSSICNYVHFIHTSTYLAFRSAPPVPPPRVSIPDAVDTAAIDAFVQGACISVPTSRESLLTAKGLSLMDRRRTVNFLAAAQSLFATFSAERERIAEQYRCDDTTPEDPSVPARLQNTATATRAKRTILSLEQKVALLEKVNAGTQPAGAAEPAETLASLLAANSVPAPVRGLVCDGVVVPFGGIEASTVPTTVDATRMAVIAALAVGHDVRAAAAEDDQPDTTDGTTDRLRTAVERATVAAESLWECGDVTGKSTSRVVSSTAAVAEGTSANVAVSRLGLFIEAAGRYSGATSPLLWPQYGSGDVVQAFAWGCSVFGGVAALHTEVASAVRSTVAASSTCREVALLAAEDADESSKRVANQDPQPDPTSTPAAVAQDDSPLTAQPTDCDTSAPAVELLLRDSRAPGSSEQRASVRTCVYVRSPDRRLRTKAILRAVVVVDARTPLLPAQAVSAAVARASTLAPGSARGAEDPLVRILQFAETSGCASKGTYIIHFTAVVSVGASAGSEPLGLGETAVSDPQVLRLVKAFMVDTMPRSAALSAAHFVAAVLAVLPDAGYDASAPPQGTPAPSAAATANSVAGAEVGAEEPTAATAAPPPPALWRATWPSTNSSEVSASAVVDGGLVPRGPQVLWAAWFALSPKGSADASASSAAATDGCFVVDTPFIASDCWGNDTAIRWAASAAVGITAHLQRSGAPPCPPFGFDGRRPRDISGGPTPNAPSQPLDRFVWFPPAPVSSDEADSRLDDAATAVAEAAARLTTNPG